MSPFNAEQTSLFLKRTECLKFSLSRMFEIMQTGVVNKAKSFTTRRKIGRSFQTHKLWNDTAGILWKLCVKLVLRALKMWFASSYISLKRSWKELTGYLHNSGCSSRNFSTSVETFAFDITQHCNKDTAI
jgi:hypothetical protein